MLIKRKSYAKINYNLKIIKRDKNGYHKLESIMSLIDLYDEVIFEENDEIEVKMIPEIVSQEDNLCYKVAAYLKKYSKTDKGVKITINKKIPIGGGLGGGSSNAAVVMMFLNNYWKMFLNKKQLMQIAFKFGADIPFFMAKRQSRVYGFGQNIKKMEKPIDKKIVLIIPSFSLETKKVFQCLDIDNLDSKNRKNCKKINDLEKSANKLTDNKINYIKNIVEEIGKGYCLMSGSGSTVVYYIDEELETCEEVYTKIKHKLLDCDVILSKIKLR